MTDDHTQLLRVLLTAVNDLDVSHPWQAERVLLAVAVAGKGVSDDIAARSASMPVDVVRAVHPSMLDRCLHVPALLTAKAHRTPAGPLCTGIQLTDEGQRRVLLLRDYLAHE